MVKFTLEVFRDISFLTGRGGGGGAVKFVGGSQYFFCCPEGGITFFCTN